MENRSTHLSTWVNADLKERFAAAAARQGLSESALLKRLVEQMLAGVGEELTAARPASAARNARVTVRLVPDDGLLLRERAAARGMPAASYVSSLVRSHLRSVTPLPYRELEALRSAVTQLAAILESTVIAFLRNRVFGISHDAGTGSLVVVPPFQPADLRLAPGGGERKLQDGEHRNPRAFIAMREVVAQLLEFPRSRPPSALARLADEAQLRARIACLLDDLGSHRKLPDTPSGPKHHPRPDVRSFATVAGPAPLARLERT